MPEYSPLLAPGFTDIDLRDLERLFVEPFPTPGARRSLVARFRDLVSLLQEISIECDLWLDGSFTTNNPEPGDIDVVIFSDEENLSRLTVSQREKFRRLLSNKDLTQYRYSCDVSYCERRNAGKRSYWRGWFGFSSDTETPKGIARLHLVPT